MRPDPSDIAARRLRNARPKRGSSTQPLKPRDGNKVALIVIGLIMTASFVIVVRNSEDIAQYVNRPITKVRMENQWQRLVEAEVGGMITAFMGTGFFKFDVSGVKETLEQHPWVAEASVKRIWPDSLSLSLTEHVAIARWGQDELLNQFGEIFQPENIDELTSLPTLSGPVDSQIAVMEQYQLLSQLLFSTDLRLNGLELSQRGSWELTLNDSMQVTVGRDPVIERLQRFIGFIEGQSAEETADISSVDLRYDNGIAIKNSREELAEVAVR
ncbi:MAG: FtsQ-type POTRA domain-containing protein [Pseudomonadales bacterium]|nr:FtsQ-type POTRA domain-containing protein [Pseudomonadales bacterium]